MLILWLTILTALFLAALALALSLARRAERALASLRRESSETGEEFASMREMLKHELAQLRTSAETHIEKLVVAQSEERATDKL